MEANGTDPQQRQRKKKAGGGGNTEKAAEGEGDDATPSAEVSGAYKWGSACLTVLPDAWLIEEVARRARSASEKGQDTGQGSEQMDLNGATEVPSGAQSAPLIQMPNASKVMLCNTGKCEMFD